MATSAKDWKGSKGLELELPSENTALVRRPGPEALLRKGVLPDAMRPMITDMIKSGQGMRREDVDKMAADPEMIIGMMDTMDRVLCLTVIQPHVIYPRGVKTPSLDNDGFPVYAMGSDDEMVTIPPEDRHPERLYADDVDFEDKQFIFQFVVGGTKDIARFREQSGVSVGDVPDVEDDVVPPFGTTVAS